MVSEYLHVVKNIPIPKGTMNELCKIPSPISLIKEFWFDTVKVFIDRYLEYDIYRNSHLCMKFQRLFFIAFVCWLRELVIVGSS